MRFIRLNEQLLQTPSEIEKKLVESISNALYDINELLGYEYFEKKKIEKNSQTFLQVLPFAEELLKKARGVSIKDLEKEKINSEKAKEAAILGIFHGHILKNYKGNSFDEKFQDYLYSSNIEICEWEKQTDYENYYTALTTLVSKIISNTSTLNFIHEFLKIKTNSTSQGITKVFTKKKFFKNTDQIDELVIDEHMGIFHILSAIAENQLKMLYGIKHNYKSPTDPKSLEQTPFYFIWNDLRKDTDLKIFTKPFPNTIYWNASKHNGVTKKVGKKEVEFDSSDGIRRLSYNDFVQTVRELYAGTITLMKITIMVVAQSKALGATE